MISNIKRYLQGLVVLGTLAIFVFCMPINVKAEEAKEIEGKYATSAGDNFADGHDGSYSTKSKIPANGSLTIKTDENLRGLYIEWNRVPGEWTLSYNNEEVKCGANEFLHEFVAIPAGVTEVTLKAGDTALTVCNIDLYGEGDLPEKVQVWQPPCEKADILVFPTHADDEILFLGATLVNYAGRDDLAVQVAYMCEFYSTGADIREHEKLNGLWMCKVENYPVCGDFGDYYASSLENAIEVYENSNIKPATYEDIVSFTTETVRRFQPLVVVSQDFNGEYGHGGHILFAKAIGDAVDHSMEADFCPDSASLYGTYDVPKAYFHLYDMGGDKEITLDTREELSAFDSDYYRQLIKDLLKEDVTIPTCYDICRIAYKQHVSQQWCSFLVAEDYDISSSNIYGRHFSIRQFGLYRTTVGADVNKNDLMENLKSYEQLAAEEETKRQEEEAQKNSESSGNASGGNQQASGTALDNHSVAKVIGLVALVILLVLVIAVLLRIVYVQNEKKKRKKRRAQARKKNNRR